MLFGTDFGTQFWQRPGYVKKNVRIVIVNANLNFCYNLEELNLVTVQNQSPGKVVVCKI